jgi:pyridoxal phosphate enzyme (YggS family)
MLHGFETIKKSLPGHVRLVAVTKNRSVADILQLYEAGQRDFGENRVQELMQKVPALPADIRWHLIGHLQTNKVKYVAGKVYLIHSVDSEKLLDILESYLAIRGLKQDILLQVHIARETSKFGFTFEALNDLFRRKRPLEWPHVRICGLMGMATNTEDHSLVRSEFHKLHDLFLHLKESIFSESEAFCELSMGMSGDWPIAVEEGATMVRIGSALFEKNS